MNPSTWLPLLLSLAWLLPLASFVLIGLGGSLPQLTGGQLSPKLSKFAGLIATATIASGLLLSLAALGIWLGSHPPAAVTHDAVTHDATHNNVADLPAHYQAASPHDAVPSYYTGDFYTFASFGELRLSIGYYIDAMTITLFCMITLIATCVHVYSWGYMHEELGEVTDPEAPTADGKPFRRPGRYHRFFQYLSLFSFSMLGVVIAGNLGMVFMFWELVGICSYFLIGFYIERPSATLAANKAFIVNRVGDFGMLIGLMALWSSLGTLNFGDLPAAPGSNETRPGIFTQLASLPTSPIVVEASDAAEASVAVEAGSSPSYLLLFVAGLGLFCGCVGKSAQFPLHTWLPDAMEGPTPVSALVHSATMVAAGVYLVGRCYPIFLPEVLLTIAIIGAITLAFAASVAITAVDIKRVLAYSTISQLGYMMLALGLGGWVAGLFHLITHAFFKSLLFLCSGSVIHAVGTNDMREMGGLWRKIPWTAATMLIGCLAIIGAGLPVIGIGFSGYYSKDSIIEQAWSFAAVNPSPLYQLLLWVPVGGAVVTAFYMFRLWYLTFAGTPRNADRYEHAHESPRSMIGPLALLATFAIGIGWAVPMSGLSVTQLLEQARPAGTLATTHGEWLPALTLPSKHLSHAPEIKFSAGLTAFCAAMTGLFLATLIYLWRTLRAEEIAQTFRPLYQLLWHKWWFDEIYNVLLVRPILFASRFFSAIDHAMLDPLINGSARLVIHSARLLNTVVERRAIDGTLDRAAQKTWSLGLALRQLQTGNLRQYIMLIVASTLGLFAAASLYWKFFVAG